LSPELSGFFAPGQKSLSLKEQPHEIETGQNIIFLDWGGFLKEAIYVIVSEFWAELEEGKTVAIFL
jgi:hypothetical protein